MRTTGALKADDGDTRVTVTVTIDHKRGSLMASEQRLIRKQFLREASQILPKLRYTDFGIENIKLTKPAASKRR